MSTERKTKTDGYLITAQVFVKAKLSDMDALARCQRAKDDMLDAFTDMTGVEIITPPDELIRTTRR